MYNIVFCTEERARFFIIFSSFSEFMVDLFLYITMLSLVSDVRIMRPIIDWIANPTRQNQRYEHIWAFV